jgi:hypothetical protein
MGSSSALANEKCQALALLTRSLWQRMPEAARYVHRTPQGAQAAGRTYPTQNMRPGKSACQSWRQKLTIKAGLIRSLKAAALKRQPWGEGDAPDSIRGNPIPVCSLVNNYGVR